MQEPAAPVVDPVLGHSLSRFGIHRRQTQPRATPSANPSVIVQRDPAPGSPAAAANSGTSEEAKQKILAALQQSPQGREALQISQTLKIQIVYQANGPNQYRLEANLCLINSSMPPGDVAAYFVHEMYHAQRNIQDPTHDDPTKSGEDAFVTRMVQVEIDGTVLTI